MPLDACPVGHYILVKFLEPRQSSAERLGIVGIKFYGFNRKAVFVEEFSLVKTILLKANICSIIPVLFSCHPHYLDNIIIIE